MEVIEHDIDPNGDLLIILKRPNTQNMIPHDLPDVPPKQLNRPSVSSGLPVFDTSGRKEVEIQLRVSSYHMILASPVFEKMLKGPWVEATVPEAPASPDFSPSPTSLFAESIGTLPSDLSTTPPDPSGAVVPASDTSSIASVISVPPIRHVSATGWDAEALMVILNIIHGRHQDVPRNVSLTFFAHFATIVDYYQCERSVELAAIPWRDPFDTDLNGERLIVWLYIAWVFSWGSFFSAMAGVALRCSSDLNLIETHDLPVGELVETMERKRQSLISRILEALDDLAAKLLDGRAGCNHRCSSLMLGSLMRERHAMTLLNPPIGHTLTGFSIYDVSGEVEKFRDIKSGHKCSIQKLMKPIIDQVFEDAGNLNLSEFKSQSQVVIPKMQELSLDE